ncbi:autotransporter outer membrane beta-barrel domain-containing protein [Enterobacteriaceae bacterium LUAb1]
MTHNIIWKKKKKLLSSLIKMAVIMPAGVMAASPIAWHVTDGTSLDVNDSYQAQNAQDYPLFAQGEGSQLNVVSPGLQFGATENSSYAAWIKNHGVLILNDATLTTSGVTAHAVSVDNGTVSDAGSTIATTGGASSGIMATEGSTITLSGTMLNTAGTSIQLDNSTLNASDITISVKGPSWNNGVLLNNRSHASVDNLTLLAKERAVGIRLQGESATKLVTGMVENSTITTDEGTGLLVMDGNATLNNTSISTTGDDAYAVDANIAANINIIGGKFSTQGDDSFSVAIQSKNSTVNAKNAIFSTEGYGAHAFNAQLGNATISDSQLSTQGAGAYGLYTEAQVQGDHLDIGTHGKSGTGVFAARGGEITLSNSRITTDGDNARGLLVYPESIINADNVTVTTTGKNAVALQTYVGNAHMSNSQLSAEGDAAAIFASGASDTLKNSITLDNVQVHSAQAQAVDVSNTVLDMHVTDSTMNGGNGQLMTVRHSEQDPDLFFSKVTLNATHSALQGDVISDSTSNHTGIALIDRSALTGAAVNISDINIDSSSRWNLTGHSSVDNLTTEGTIAFIPGGAEPLHTLTIKGDYTGNEASMMMNSVLSDDHSPGDKMIVKGNVNAGTTYVAVNNLGGKGAETQNGIELIHVDGVSKGEFVKSGRIVAGAYDYDLVKHNEDWYLTSKHAAISPPGEDIESPEENVIRPEGGIYAANLAAANTLFTTRLHDRLGETHFIDAGTGEKQVTSLWLRNIGGHTRSRDSSGQLRAQGNSYVAQIGGDVAQWHHGRGDRYHLGLMAGYANQHNQANSRVTGYRAKGRVYGYSFGLYGTWLQDNKNKTGAYVDSWVLYSWFRNRIQGDEIASERYKSHGVTASLEGGYTWEWRKPEARKHYYIQPQAQITWMGVTAKDHHESNGTHISSLGENNIQTRLGLRAFIKGYHKMDEGKQRIFEPFVELNWLHNTKNYGVTMDNIRVNQQGARNLGEVKLGVEGQINSYVNLWINIAQQLGQNGYSDTRALVGVKANY